MIPVSGPQLRIYVIRHGETAWSLSGKHTGRTDIPLTAHGEAEARNVERALRGTAFTHVLSSPRSRAQKTCELAGLGDQVVIDPDLAEWDYGDFEGRLTRDIRAEWPHWNIYRDGCPGGEAPDQVSGRADRLLGKVATYRGNVALFSHGHFGRGLGVRWIGLPIAAAQHLLLGTASVSILGFNPVDADLRVIDVWNAAG